MLKQRMIMLLASCLALVFVLPLASLFGAANPVQEGEMAGYLLVPNDKVPETYNAGFSMYVAAWPLLREIHFKPIMAALVDVGYRGYVGHEYIPTRDPLQGLIEAISLCDV